MLIKRPNDIQPSEITPRSVFRERRRFMSESAGLATAAMFGGALSLLGSRQAAALAVDPDAKGPKLEGDCRERLPHRRGADAVLRHHELQQLLRVRDRQARSRTTRGQVHSAPLEGQGARRVREAGRVRLR